MNNIDTMKSQSGQVLLITLLILSVATTIALSLIGRTTTDVSISNKVEESSRAFSAAEAGIEEALKNQGAASGSITMAGGEVTYSVSNPIAVGSGAGNYILPRKTQKGQTETIWLAAHDGNGQLVEAVSFPRDGVLDLCWSDETTPAAMVVSVLYKLGTAYNVRRGAYDNTPNSRPGGANGFTSIGGPGNNCGTTDGNYFRQVINLGAAGFNLPVGAIPLALRIRPIYGEAQIIVDPTSGNLPAQGLRYDSTGVVSNTGISRKVVVYQQYRAPGAIFDYALYAAGGDIAQ